MPLLKSGSIWAYLLKPLSLSFAIMLVVFAFNMVGDGLRDALDPKLRGILLP
jgi:ABC-type dipeptide/oligopeptide/nickel transport system permease subunit